MIVLYLKWCEALHRFCVNENVWLFFFQVCFNFFYSVFVSRIFSLFGKLMFLPNHKIMVPNEVERFFHACQLNHIFPL